MSLISRIDGRSEDNNSFDLKDSLGNTLVTVKVLDSSSVTVDIDTKVQGMYIEKPSGWRCAPKLGDAE